MSFESSSDRSFLRRLAWWWTNVTVFVAAEWISAATPLDAEPPWLLGVALGVLLAVALVGAALWHGASRLPLLSRLDDRLVAFAPGALLLVAKVPPALGVLPRETGIWLAAVGVVAVLLLVPARRERPGLFTYAVMCLALWLPAMRIKDLARIGETHSRQVVLETQMAVFLATVALFYACLLLAGERLGVTRRTAALGGGALLVVVLAWRLVLPPTYALDAPPAKERLGRGTPLIVIILDTTRADHLSLYGYPRDTSPELERFAEDAVVYEHAVSTSSWTLPSHASLFTGLFPLTHGALRLPGLADERDELADQGIHRPSFPLPEDVPTLAEHLQAQSFETGALVANFAYLDPVFGVARGFDTYFSVRNTPVEPMILRLLDRRLRPLPWARRHWQVYRSAEQINRLAFRWLASRSTHRFFLFLNYMEPHLPWGPHQPGLRYEDFAAEPELPAPPGGAPVPGPEWKERVDLYDSNVASLDRQIGRLFDHLREEGLYDRSLIVVTADHGESFGENGADGHGKSLNEAEVWVPLLIKYPESRETGRRPERIQLVDLVPTLTAELGRPFPGRVEGHVPDELAERHEAMPDPATLDSAEEPEGESATAKPETVTDPGGTLWLRLAEMYGDPTDTTGAYRGYLVALFDGERKLIVRDDGELFFSRAQSGLENPVPLPEELRPWAEAQRQELLERRRLLEERALARQQALELDPEVQKGLEALGYV